MNNPTFGAGHTPPMRFAELINAAGKRLHVGCVMAVGDDWVEVSLPESFALAQDVRVRFPPSSQGHAVHEGWRRSDRVGLAYRDGGPPADQFVGFINLGTAAARMVAGPAAAPSFIPGGLWPAGSATPQ